jgi:hypothetical protein
LLDELNEVLHRGRLRRFISRGDASAFVEYLSRVADMRADPVPVTGLVPEDPDYDFLFALALTPAQLVAELERRMR